MKKPKRIGSRGSLHAPPTNAFKPGGPPGPGRPKTDSELQEAYRDRTGKALAVIDKVLDGYLAPKPTVSARDALSASELVTTRGWGAAPSSVKLSGAVEVNAAIAHDVKAELLQSPERLQRIVGVLMRANALPAETAPTPAVVPTKDEEPTP